MIFSLRNEANHARFLASYLGQGERTEVRVLEPSCTGCPQEKPHPPLSLQGRGDPYPAAYSSEAAAVRSIASPEDAGRVFAMVKPNLAVVYHYNDEEGLEDAVRKEYKGPFVIARELMVINVGKTVTCDGKSSADTTPDGDKSRR